MSVKKDSFDTKHSSDYRKAADISSFMAALCLCSCSSKKTETEKKIIKEMHDKGKERRQRRGDREHKTQRKRGDAH